MPVIVRDTNDDEAIICIVDSDIQQETLLPSEKTLAYKMKLDAMKRQGSRSDLTASPMGTKVCSDEIIAQQDGESRNRIQRNVHLNELIPELFGND